MIWKELDCSWWATYVNCEGTYHIIIYMYEQIKKQADVCFNWETDSVINSLKLTYDTGVWIYAYFSLSFYFSV